MNKKEIQTKKLYYGFPIILLAYKDMEFGYNITTISSSYSLGDMLIIGLSKTSNTAKNIINYGKFSVNLANKELSKELEISGFLSNTNKLEKSNLNYILTDNEIPIIRECSLNIECIVQEIVEFEDYVNIISKINKRYIDEKLLNADKTLNNEMINPVLFIGDSKKRIYKYTSQISNELGSFFDNE